MRVEVILLEKIPSLGPLGTRAKVARGYANYLVQHGRALRATKHNLADFKIKQADLEHKAALALQAAEQRAAQLSQLNVSIAAKASEEGKLYGSITNRELVLAIGESGIKVERSEINMPNGPIRETGEHTIDLQLHSDVLVSLKVQVVGEK